MLLTSPATVHYQTEPHFQAQQPRYPQTLDFDPTSDPPAFADSTFSNLSTTSPDSTQPLYAFAQPQQRHILGLGPSTSSLAAGPHRQQHVDHQRSSSLSTAASSTGDDYSAGLNQLPDLMPSEPWALASQYTPKTFGRMSHQRESSLSSLGSAGPASPFNHHTSNPHIAVSDPASDGFADMQAHDSTNSYYQLAKAMAGQAGMYPGYHSMTSIEHPEMGYPSAISMHQRPRTEKTGLLPAPDYGNTHNRSHPASVASSTVGGDSPATPSLGEPVEEDKRRITKTTLAEPPKLDRTMTDIYSDELYNPSFTITSASPSHPQHVAMSPSNDLFAQRLNAANNQHLSASQSPSSSVSRDRSPFRHGSPHAPVNHDFAGAFAGSTLRFNSAHQMREKEKAEQDVQMLRQQMAPKTESETPKTISPKDAMLEFQGPDTDSTFPSLFASQEATSDYGSGPVTQIPNPHDKLGIFQRQPSQPVQQPGGFPFMNQQQLPTTVHIPQQYPFIAHSRPQHQQSPSHLSPGDSSAASSSNTPVNMARPNGTAADGGTYTCTYHGCTLRFETPALLQKHKREGHRQPQGLGTVGSRRPDAVNATASALLNSQAGPHRCDRINPSTGKSCNTIFSRPYDLTRHEDTIHNARKQKVRCSLCTEEKTFSRADALTRHYRVCHPDVEFPGKYRRRGGIN